ncbi:TPA: DUF521 domain-containing protein, partial [Candidatus Bathyarchaeota archaeon]|nr:DUF521 domain-containing protein [Candidatus Bathyarchaeota archaeon]
MLDGELGEAKALAMKLVAALGDVFGAKRTVRVKSVQISGVSYKTIGDHGLEFVVDLRDKGGKFSVPSTINPAGMDLENWRRMG